MNDLKFAWRLLFKNPGFTAVAVLTLGLGIGANSAIFTVVNNVLLRPLPYANSDRLVVIWEANLKQGIKRVGPSGSDYLDWKEKSQSFEEVAAFDHGSGTVTGLGEPEQVAGMRVTVNLFSLLGKHAALGRTFLPDEGHGGRHNTVIFTHQYWQRRFGADPHIIGRKVTVDGLSYEVVGVLPADFYFPVPSELFVPWDDDELRSRSRNAFELGVFARLKPRVTVAEAHAELNILAEHIAALFPEKRDWGVTVMPLKRALLAYVQPAFVALLGAVGFLLAIACANVAHLLLARAAGRRREIAIRLAVGADRWRIVRQLLTETLVLAFVGGAAGLLLSYWFIDLVRAILPDRIPVPDAAVDILLRSYHLDGTAFAFTLLLCLVCGLGFGLAPALQARRCDLTETLKDSTARPTWIRRRFGRQLLIVVEMAASLVLLSGVGLMIQTLLHLQAVNPGFQTKRALAMEIELPTDSKYRQTAEQAEFFRRAFDEVQRVPGVQSAGFVECLPLDEENTWRNFQVEGRPVPAPGQQDRAEYRRVGGSYFETLSIPVLEGRTLNQRDDAKAPVVAVVDQALARRYWPGESALGKRLRIDDGQREPREIVGVVGGVRHFGLDQAISPLIYVPEEQQPTYRMSLVVRTGFEPATLVEALKKAIWRVDATQPVYKVRTMDQLLSGAVAVQRMTLDLLGAFAVAALLLAAVGTYGVISYSVAQRVREIGIRLALGARQTSVLRLVLGQTLRFVLLGIGLGLAGAYVLTRSLSSILFGVPPTDPLAFGGAALLLIMISLAAAYWPARRATRIDPTCALRAE
jgi:putative ABC transport system permease protein